MSYIPPPARTGRHQPIQQTYSPQLNAPQQYPQYPLNSPYYPQQNPQQRLPQAVPQRSNPHSGNPSPQLQSNNLSNPHDNGLVYQLQHASQSPNPPPHIHTPPQSAQQRQTVPAPILPPSRTPHNVQNNGQTNVQTNGQNGMQDAQQTPDHVGASESPAPQNIVSDNVSGSPHQIPGLTAETMTLPPEGQYATFDELLHHANQHAFAHGYALVIARSKRKGPKSFKKVLIACDRWGPVQHSGLRPEHLRKRNTSSKKTDCKFGFHAIENATEWKLQYRTDDASRLHNHGPSQDMTKHAAARKLNGAAMAAIKAYSDAGLSVKETVEQIQLAQPGAMVIARDVYNARALLKREPEKFPDIDPTMLPPIVVRPNLSAEEKIRDECRAEVIKAKEETELARKEVEELKRKLAEKDKMIEKFEMFIDICNQRVMVQRERLNADEGAVGGVGNTGTA